METFPRYWPLVRGIHRSPVNSPHKGQWRRASMFSLICVWINGWLNNHEAGGLRRYRAHYDVIVVNSWVPLRASFYHRKLYFSRLVKMEQVKSSDIRTPKPPTFHGRPWCPFPTFREKNGYVKKRNATIMKISVETYPKVYSLHGEGCCHCQNDLFWKSKW